MLHAPASVAIYVYTAPADLRKGFDGPPGSTRRLPVERGRGDDHAEFRRCWLAGQRFDPRPPSVNGWSGRALTATLQP